MTITLASDEIVIKSKSKGLYCSQIFHFTEKCKLDKLYIVFKPDSLLKDLNIIYSYVEFKVSVNNKVIVAGFGIKHTPFNLGGYNINYKDIINVELEGSWKEELENDLHLQMGIRSILE